MTELPTWLHFSHFGHSLFTFWESEMNKRKLEEWDVSDMKEAGSANVHFQCHHSKRVERTRKLNTLTPW